jgi:hypothetical protein
MKKKNRCPAGGKHETLLARVVRDGKPVIARYSVKCGKILK